MYIKTEFLLRQLNRLRPLHIRNSLCYFGCIFDLLIDLIDLIDLSLEAKRPVYVQSLICVRVCSDMRRIALVLMHILIQPPSSYKSSFSYKISDDAETHDPSTHATVSGSFQTWTRDISSCSPRSLILPVLNEVSSCSGHLVSCRTLAVPVTPPQVESMLQVLHSCDGNTRITTTN